MAFVSLSAEVEPGELRAFVAERVAAYKALREVDVVDRVPRLPTGKLPRQVLRELANSATPA